jgi:hypothetical protein
MTGIGNTDENGLRLRRGTGLALRNTLISGSAVCIRVDGTSRDLLGTGLTIESTSLDCAELTSNDDDGAVADYISTATNVTTDGSTPPAGDLPDDGFFEQTDVIGSDFDSWRGNWVFGL